MSKQCKCEHWQQCPVCMPHRFDSNGNLLPPEPTPLQAARIRIEELERENNELAARIGKELNEENLALQAEIAELVGVLGNVTAHLVAAHSLLSRGGKKAAASDTIFKIMLQDYEKSFEAGRKALAKVRKP